MFFLAPRPHVIQIQVWHELEPARSFGFSRLATELQVGDVYLRLFVADPSVAEIEHPDRFARALLKSLGGLSVIVGQAGDEEAEGETIAASGRQGDTAPAVDGIDGGKQPPQGPESDCAMVCSSLQLLLRTEPGTKDVISDAGLRCLMPLVASPIAGSPFAIGCELLKEMGAYRPFAQKAAKDATGLWALLKRFATAKEPNAPPAAWACAEMLCSTNEVVEQILNNGLLLLLLAVVVGHPDCCSSLEGRCGALSILQRCLRDPITGPRVLSTLVRFLPGTVANSVRDVKDPAETLKQFDVESETPALVWNKSMRGTLRAAVAEEYKRYREACPDGGAEGPEGHAWQLKHDYTVHYPELDGELVVGGIYLRLFLKEPTFDLPLPLEFLEQLLLKFFGDLEAQLSEQGVARHNAAVAAAAKASEAGAAADGEGGGGGAEDGTAGIMVIKAADETLSLVTSAIVYLLKVRLPLCDQLASWGYTPRLVALLKTAVDVGALGAPAISCVRVIHQVSEATQCIEALVASEDGVLVQLLRLLRPTLCKDTAFVVETIKRMFIHGKGEAHGYEMLVQVSWVRERGRGKYYFRLFHSEIWHDEIEKCSNHLSLSLSLLLSYHSPGCDRRAVAVGHPERRAGEHGAVHRHRPRRRQGAARFLLVFVVIFSGLLGFILIDCLFLPI